MPEIKQIDCVQVGNDTYDFTLSASSTLQISSLTITGNLKVNNTITGNNINITNTGTFSSAIISNTLYTPDIKSYGPTSAISISASTLILSGGSNIRMQAPSIRFGAEPFINQSWLSINVGSYSGANLLYTFSVDGTISTCSLNFNRDGWLRTNSLSVSSLTNVKSINATTGSSTSSISIGSDLIPVKGSEGLGNTDHHFIQSYIDNIFTSNLSATDITTTSLSVTSKINVASISATHITANSINFRTTSDALLRVDGTRGASKLSFRVVTFSGSNNDAVTLSASTDLGLTAVVGAVVSPVYGSESVTTFFPEFFVRGGCDTRAGNIYDFNGSIGDNFLGFCIYNERTGEKYKACVIAIGY